MTNGEDLPPAWTDSAEHRLSMEPSCKDCGITLDAEGPYCDICEPDHYFTMG